MDEVSLTLLLELVFMCRPTVVVVALLKPLLPLQLPTVRPLMPGCDVVTVTTPPPPPALPIVVGVLPFFLWKFSINDEAGLETPLCELSEKSDIFVNGCT